MANDFTQATVRLANATERVLGLIKTGYLEALDKDPNVKALNANSISELESALEHWVQEKDAVDSGNKSGVWQR